MIRIVKATALLLFATSLLLGCSSGKKNAEGPVAKSVSVHVSFGDKPVTEGTVQLVMPNSKNSASGQLDASGDVKFKDVPVGSYTVIVMPPAEKDPDPMNPTPVKRYDNIPLKYRNQTSSPLKAAVAESGENAFSFDLKK